MFELVKIEKSKNPKYKYTAIFKNKETGKEKKTNFGASGYEDYTMHKNKERRNRYIERHKKDLKTNDYTRAGYLSMFILWNKPTLKASIEDYKRRIKTNDWTLPN